jgi:5'-nucleotidase
MTILRKHSNQGAGRLALAMAATLLAPLSLVGACGSNSSSNPGMNTGGDAGSGSDGIMGSSSGSSTSSTSSSSGSSSGSSSSSSSSSSSGSSSSSSGGTEAGLPPINVEILAFNDFHGNLRPPSPSNGVLLAKANDPIAQDAGIPVEAGTGDAGGYSLALFTGGAAYFASHVASLRAQNPNNLLVSAGDLTGASPLISALYDDEPTIQVMNAIGLDLNGVGNHEFDKGPSQLERLQHGGCDVSLRTDGGYGSCEADPTFPGASFEYLAANVDTTPPEAGTPMTLFPPYAIKMVGGAKIAFIGMTLQGTAGIVLPSATVGLTFVNEVATANALVPELKKQNVDAIVVLLHQGGFQSGTYNDCVNLSGPGGGVDIGALADALDPAISVVHSAHTHVAYNCVRSNGRLLTSAASYGRIITQINLTIDPNTHTVTNKTATNVAVTRDVTPDPVIAAMVQKYANDVAPVAEVQVGTISADILKNTGPNGEAPLGDVITDSMAYYATSLGKAVDVAFTNIGGVRDSLLYKHYYSEPDGDVTYEKAAAVLPFGNTVVLVQCKGSDIIAATQQNLFVEPGGLTKVLQVSSSFSYSWATTAANASGQNAADPTSFMINGTAINPTATYNVLLNNFIQTGGDGYTAFKNCTSPVTLGIDLTAFTTYLGSHPNLGPPPANRITKTN